MKKFFVILSTVIILALLLNICGCSTSLEAEDLMVNITPNNINKLENVDKGVSAVNNFSINFLKVCQNKGENTLVSPLSAIYALGMATNGAKGETLTQMEKVLGMKKDDLNLYLYSIMQKIKYQDGAKFNIANSLWFTESGRFDVNNNFLQTNADYYGAKIYREPFNKTTIKKINSWVNKETHGMIKDIVDDTFLNQESIMCLINAICFEGEWINPYEELNVKEDEFTNADGSKSDCTFLYSNESNFIEDDNSKGFIKPYCNGDYAFAAILPNQGITLEQYLSTLNGEKLGKMLKAREIANIETSMPKFETEFDFNVSKQLKNMGMTLAFDTEKADFSALGISKKGNIYIDEVKQKTFISVTEKGTKAGAATAVTFKDEMMIMDEVKEVHLNRPFIYMIIDTNLNIPLFIGIMNNVENK